MKKQVKYLLFIAKIKSLKYFEIDNNFLLHTFDLSRYVSTAH